MKITAMLLLAACLTASASGLSQPVSLSVKNAPLETVFKEIKRQTGYQFLYNVQLIDKTKTVTVNLKNMPLEQALTACFAGQPLTYTIIDRTIVVKPATVVPGTSVPPPAPFLEITGKVTDESGAPLAGATVTVKGTANITKTDAGGMFVLRGVADDAVLEITYAEYEKATLKVSERTSFVIILKRAETTMGEVIVNKGYYTEKQKYSVGNVTHIDAKVIEQQPVQNSLLALQGRVAGLEVIQTTGINGGAVKTRVQGINSIGSLSSNYPQTSTDPLVVVDGVPYPTQLTGSATLEGLLLGGGSPLNYINPGDIESIDVLKDADATSIYGSRAANGAILITTKKGKSGRTRLSANVQQGWSKVAHPVEMLNTRQYLDMRYEAYRNQGININTLTPGFSNYDIKVWDTTRYTDWQKELIGGTAQYTTVNAGVSGGTNAIQYLVSGFYNRRTTVFPGNFDDKVAGLHFNTSGSSANQRFKMQLTGSYSFDQNHLPTRDLTQYSIYLSPNAPSIYNTDGTLNWAPTATGASTWINPLAYTENSDFKNTTKTLVANISAGYMILPGLEIRGNFGYTNLNAALYTPTRLEYYRPEMRASNQRSATFGNREMSTWLTEPQLNYRGKLGKGTVDALIGTTIQQSTQSYLAVTGRGQPNDLLLKSLTAATSLNIAASESSTFKFNGLFARLNYNWNEKYVVNLTARRDGSNKFGDGNKFHNFASAGMAWIFSGEKWVQQNLPFLSLGKLRASYGTTGNDQIPDFTYLSLYQVNNPGGVLYQNILGLGVVRHSNPFVQWEETRKLQGGIDLGFFNNRIVLGVTYARNRSSNQLTNYSLPDLTGFDAIVKNLPALIQNTSWEFTLNTGNVTQNDFTWTTNINLTIPRNKLVSFPGIESTPYASGGQGLIIGQPLGILKAFRYAGVDPVTGFYMAYDATGTPVRFPTEAEKTELVSTLPKLYGGIVNSVSYKGFQLDFLLQAVVQKGQDDFFYNNGFSFSPAGPGYFSGGSGVIGNQPLTVMSNPHWQKAGDAATIAKYWTAANTPNIPAQSSIGYTYDAGSWVRLKNVSLSWQLPQNWLAGAHIQNARVYFNGQNLATFTGYNGLDPETRGNANLPPLRTWTFGLKLDL